MNQGEARVAQLHLTQTTPAAEQLLQQTSFPPACWSGHSLQPRAEVPRDAQQQSYGLLQDLKMPMARAGNSLVLSLEGGCRSGKAVPALHLLPKMMRPVCD